MALTQGMNVGEVRAQAKQLQAASGEIMNLINKINGVLGCLEQNWKGKDFNDFKGWWEGQHRPALKTLADRIQGLAQSANNNASEQEAVSNR